jgi:hypothetical protein
VEDNGYKTNTIVSLRDYVDTRLLSLEKATESARVAMERRLDGMNEFRDALRDQASLMITRREMMSELDPIKRELQDSRDFRVTLQAKASQQSVYITLLIALASLVINIVKLVQ